MWNNLTLKSIVRQLSLAFRWDTVLRVPDMEEAGGLAVSAPSLSAGPRRRQAVMLS